MMDLPTIISWVGTVIGIILNLSPAVLFYNIHLGKEKYTNIPESMLIFNILCSSLWACYWYLQEDKFVPFFSAMAGLGLSEIFSLLYLYYFSGKCLKKYLLFALLEINLVIEFNYVLIRIIGDYSMVGNIAVVVNILTYITPGQNIIKVCKEKNYRLIPIASTLSGASCALSWLLFGILIKDIHTIIPNSLGLIFAAINSFTWAYFYCNRDKNDDEENGQKELITPEKEEI
jgi:solute carrier family 50 protein (sugar transporter)